MIWIINNQLRHFVNHYQDNWSEPFPAMDLANASVLVRQLK